jgi:aryl sulfotransferase
LYGRPIPLPTSPDRWFIYFLEIEVQAARWPRILEYCAFRWMKENGDNVVPLGGLFWDGGSKVFVHRGRNGRWIEKLSEEDVEAYEATASRAVGTVCARWLSTGEM